MTHKVYVEFPGRLVMLGFGSIGQGVLPLILRHIGIAADRITILSAEDTGKAEAQALGVRFLREPLLRENYQAVLDTLIGRGDFLVNVSVDVSSVALIQYCWQRGAMYLDTCIEPWAGGYTDLSLPPSRRTNYALRESALALRTAATANAPTAVITHGANPGMVSHLVKAALLNIARDTGLELAHEPSSREDWGRLAMQLGVRTIHIAERDTQVCARPKQANEFVNTWSVDGFVGEGMQPSELGWGTHERNFPPDGSAYDFGGGASIYLNRPGASTRVRTWTPLAGNFHGFLITHSESISIADYFTVRESGQVVYRPTTHYAYHPCDYAVLSIHELAGRNWQMQDHKHIMVADIISGRDELGVLLAGHARNAYWYGSQLTIEQARSLAPNNSATSLQVTASVMAGVIWAMENPGRGLVEPDEMNHRRMLEIIGPYLGTVTGAYTDWTPLTDRETLFPEDLDRSDPWQFKNVRV
ncbi:MAG: saccharopine dehydrogenase NADP-binding domain-containing protein [Nevskiaceae bacterium]|jgi:homospermidine synthase|nr:saccharopine dehydrogenase NADP-binding domain-containing protein [Nevskiaceae bacterium]